jgi:hypothetical protein
MIRTLGKRILLFVFAILLVTLAVDNILTIRQVSRDYRDSLAVRSRFLGKELSSEIEKVLSLGINLKEIDGMNNRCQQVVEKDPEIVYSRARPCSDSMTRCCAAMREVVRSARLAWTWLISMGAIWSASINACTFST